MWPLYVFIYLHVFYAPDEEEVTAEPDTLKEEVPP